jgi:DNA polymerase-3 subunit epsilon
MFAPRIAFLDLETTGMSPARERITEVGLVLVDDGQVVEEFSQLVHPGCPIPPEITYLTGISNDMVRDAPPFGAIAPLLQDKLRGRLIVAHNARFDYGFLKAEFARLELPFVTKPLCTVRLSRALYPQASGHGLDAIIARFDLDRSGVNDGQRHRALGDARLLWQLTQKLYARLPAHTIADAVKTLMKRASIPPHLSPSLLDDVPSAPGVYMFYGLNAHPLYIGKSIALKGRIAAHFYDVKSERELRLIQETQRIEHIETAGDLSACVLEAQLIGERMPAHNIALRRKANAVMLRIDVNGKPVFAKLSAWSTAQLAGSDEPWFGPFGTRASARAHLLALCREHALCAKTLGLERGTPGLACFARQMRKCLGACESHETLAEHRTRVHAALAPHAFAPWPFAGAIALIERNPARFTEDWVVADQWCVLGLVKTHAAAHALAQSAPRVLDAALYGLLKSALDAALAGQREGVDIQAVG